MRPYPTILTLTALALIGYLLLPRLSVRWQPGNGQANLRVSYAWPGAGPQALEQRVTAPLEAAFALVRDVEQIASVSQAGRGYVNLQLRRDADGEFIRFNVAAQIRRIYPELPPEVSYPTLDYAAANDNDLTEVPVLTYALSGPDPPTELYRYATEELLPRLSLLRGLNRLEVTGGNRLHWRLRLSPEKVAAAGLTSATIGQYLSAYFRRSGMGFLQLDEQKLYAYVGAGAGAKNATEWSRVPLPSTNGRQLLLGDVAETERVPLAPTSHYRVNGQNSVRLLAYATDDANRLALATDLGTRVRAQNDFLPPGYVLRLEDDSTRFLRQELAKTRQRTALSMGILLLFVLLAYRSFRRLGAVLFSLAVNLGLAFLCYWLLGVELNLYAFAGIAVSFGIMIDNVIIVLDHLNRKTSLLAPTSVASIHVPPLPRRGAGGEGIAPPVIGATLTTLASLSVIYFLSEDLRLQLYELARVMAINLTTSVLIALLFVPALEGPNKQVLPRNFTDSPNRLSRGYERILSALLQYRKITLLAVILAFGLPLWWLPTKVDNWEFYNKTLGSDLYRDEIRPVVNKYLGGTFRLFSYYVYEGGGYRPPEETRLYVGASLPTGTTLEQLDAVLRQVEGYLGQFSDRTERYTTRVYGTSGRIEITFPNGGRGGFPYTLKNRLTGYATNFGGVTWNIYGVGQGFSNDNSGGRVNFNVLLKGYNQVGLDAQSARLAELLLGHPRVQEVNTNANLNWWEKDRYEYLLTADNAALARLDLSPVDLRAALDWFDRNDRPNFFLDGGEPVAISTANPTAYDRWRLENWGIPRDSGQLSFPAVARLDKRPAPQALHKEDQQYLRLVAFDYLGSPRFGSRHLTACLDTLRAELPLGFTAERKSYSFDRQAREVSGLMGLAVVLIFFICAVLFESLRQAFNIVLLIPISCIGIFLTFYWFDVRLDQGGYTSFLLVTGLAVNGLILVVNEYNALRKRGPEESGVRLYARALGRKLTPIVLTVLSTAAGLAPFLFGGRNEVFWYALAAGTIGGLVFSLFVICLISPVFFLRRG
ncbi:MAG: efflux RND transporter permease subunit [Bacteroidota bacterium]